MDVVLLDISCPPSEVGTALRHLSDDLKEVEWVASQKLVTSARIPVLKLKSSTGVPMDITIATQTQSARLTHTGLAARDLVRSFCRQAPLIVPLVLLIKSFLRSLSLNDPFTGGVSSYCVVVLLHMFWTESDRVGAFNTADCGIVLLHFLVAFVTRFESNLTHVDDPLTPTLVADDGSLIQPCVSRSQLTYDLGEVDL
jgi:DNA polymerase sigma